MTYAAILSAALLALLALPAAAQESPVAIPQVSQSAAPTSDGAPVSIEENGDRRAADYQSQILSAPISDYGRAHAVISQSSGGNTAVITQEGPSNRSSVTQSGDHNYAGQRQKGEDNDLDVRQQGNGNISEEAQSGRRNHKKIIQNGHEYESTVDQYGNELNGDKTNP